MICNSNILQCTVPVQFFRPVFRATAKIVQIFNFLSKMLMLDKIVCKRCFSSPKIQDQIKTLGEKINSHNKNY